MKNRKKGKKSQRLIGNSRGGDKGVGEVNDSEVSEPW